MTDPMAREKTKKNKIQNDKAIFETWTTNKPKQKAAHFDLSFVYPEIVVGLSGILFEYELIVDLKVCLNWSILSGKK